MLKILRHTLDRQGFLGEVIIPDLMAPAGNSFFVSALGIDLPDPPGIPVAGRPDQDVLGEVAELETFCPAFGRFRPKTQPMFEIKGFRGKSNLSDPARILPSGGSSFLSECRDADIDDEFMIHRRGGFRAPIFPGGGIHSLWSNGDICLFVQGADLKRLNPDYTAATIFSGAGSARMVCVAVAGTVYLTNGTLIGFMRDGAFNLFPDPQQTYKSAMVAGHLIECFNGRLYVTRDNEIWFSDPMAYMRTDKRRNFKQLASRITLLSAVEDGIYVSDLEGTYFMGGGGPREAILIDKADYPAIPHTAHKIDADRIGGLGFSGPAVLWASRMGICIGGNQGQFKNITEEHFRIQGKPFSAGSIIRKEDGIYQLVCTIALNFIFGG